MSAQETRPRLTFSRPQVQNSSTLHTMSSQIGPDDDNTGRILIASGISTMDDSINYQVYAYKQLQYSVTNLGFMVYFAKGEISNSNYFSTDIVSYRQISMVAEWLNGNLPAKSIKDFIVQRQQFKEMFW